MDLDELIAQVPVPWEDGGKIPWDEPGFSGRMLAEHLSQQHDAASRRSAKIDEQVQWLHNELLGGKPSRVLDLGCGPGLYMSRLAALGHEVRGFDFSPASVRYAQEELGLEGATHGDVRKVQFGDGFNLVMMLYGEINAFHPDDANLICRKAFDALAPGGVFVLEAHTEEEVLRQSGASRTQDTLESGLFSESPHVLITESALHEETRTSILRFFVVDSATGEVERYSQTLQAYSGDEYEEVLYSAGFSDIERHQSLIGEEGVSQNALRVFVARKSADAT